MSASYEVRKGLLGHKVNYNCPACGAPLTSSLDKAGTNDACPDCGRAHKIPGSKERADIDNAEAVKQMRQSREKEQAAKALRPIAPPPINTGTYATPPAVLSSISPAIESTVPSILRQLISPGEKILFAGNPSFTVFILSAIVVAFVVGFPSMITAFLEGSMIHAVAGVVLAGILVLVVYLNWKNQFYLVTNSRTICKQGIFNVAIKILPNQNIQLISINTGIIDRLLGLNTIELSSAAAGSSGRILGLFPGGRSGGVLLRNVDMDRIIPLYAEVGRTTK